MHRPNIWTAFSLTALLFLSGCGHMRIHTNHPDAQIYLDGDLLGTGSAKVSAMGPPHEAQIRVVYNGVAKEHIVERQFKVTTALIGMVTYLTGFYWAWQYPDYVMIRLPEAPRRTIQPTVDAWSTGPAGDPWSQPMYREPKPKPAPQEKAPDATTNDRDDV